jgi:hypothetical protein
MLILTAACIVLSLLVIVGAIPNELPIEDNLPTWNDLEG